MWPFSRAKKAPPEPPSPRLVDLQLRFEELESRLEWWVKEFKTLRGRFYGSMRREIEPEGSESDEQQQVDIPVPPQINVSSAHLSRRFRGF